MKFKVGDLVRNTHEGRAEIIPDEGLGIVLKVQNGKYQQIKVATAQGITYWWPAVTELVDESR
jgi:hypothetical protein